MADDLRMSRGDDSLGIVPLLAVGGRRQNCLRQNRPHQPSEARRLPLLEALTVAPRRPTPTPTLRRLTFSRRPGASRMLLRKPKATARVDFRARA
jgi:hypothetical protein